MCEIYTIWVIAHVSFLMMTPQVCLNLTDYGECMHMADVGCTMVETCSENSNKPESYEMCYERASKKCEKFKEIR
jgi:hypothetical protein